MTTSRPKFTLKEEEVLCYQSDEEPRSQSTIRKYYIRWRQQQNPSIPERCDISKCLYYKHPLMWNGKAIKPILDHKNGNNTDNRPNNLRLVCPNCYSQLETRGGANKNQIRKSVYSFSIKGKDSKQHPELPGDSGHYSIIGNAAKLISPKETR